MVVQQWPGSSSAVPGSLSQRGGAVERQAQEEQDQEEERTGDRRRRQLEAVDAEQSKETHTAVVSTSAMQFRFKRSVIADKHPPLCMIRTMYNVTATLRPWPYPVEHVEAQQQASGDHRHRLLHQQLL